jgi:hypothetical protein
MNSETGFPLALRRLTTPILGNDPRGARHWGASLSSRHKLVFGRSVWILTMMHSCASAAKAPGGRPILSVGICAMSATGFPPPRIVNRQPAVNASASAE